MKKRFLLLLLFLSFANSIIAQVRVRGYYRKNGTYVQPHYRSKPDGNPYNNYSYPGNTNPYTGKVATGNPDTYLDNYYNRGGGNSSNSYTPTNNSSSNSSNSTYNSSGYNENSSSRTTNYKYDNPSLNNIQEFKDSRNTISSNGTAYFYNEPNINSSKVNYFIKGENLRKIKEYDGFVYVLFTKRNGNTVNGWVKKDDLSYVDNLNYKEDYNVYPSTNYFIVSQTKAFFYNEPSDYSKRKAYLVKGEKITSNRVSNGFVYVEFINNRGVRTVGWIKESDTIRAQ